MSAPEKLNLPDGKGGWMAVSVARPVDGSWQNVIGGSTAPVAAFTPDTGPKMLIGTNGAVLQNGWTPGTTGTATATRHMLHANTETLTLGYLSRPNPGMGVKENTPLRAWVRIQGGTWQACTFDGQPEVTMKGWPDEATMKPDVAQNIYTDPIPGPWRLGDVIDVLTWGQSSGTTMGAQADLDGAYDYGKLAGSPEIVSSAATTAFLPGGRGTRPSLMLGSSRGTASWALLGDSNSVNPPAPYFAQAFRGRNIPHTMNGKHGLANWNLFDGPDIKNGWWEYQIGEQLKYCDSVFNGLITNDMQKATFPSEYGTRDKWIGQMILDLAAKAKGLGVKRWVQATLQPTASSTDNYATLANQTPGWVGVRAPLNQWLRDGAPCDANGKRVETGTSGVNRCAVVTYAGTVKAGSGSHPFGSGWVSEVGAALEPAPDDGRYRVDGDRVAGSDPIHYAQAGHDRQAKILARDLALMGF